MKVLATHLGKDGKREKFLIDNWPDPEETKPGCFRTKTLHTGVTNGTERNDLTGGNYSNPDEKLPCPWGYQNVGEVVEVGEGVDDIAVGDIVYLSADHGDCALFDTAWKLYVKIPESVDKREAALFGMASVAMRTCRNANIRLGEKVLVVGAGCIGQIAAQIAHVMGGRVTIADINDKRLEIARTINAVEEAHNTAGNGWDTHIKPETFDVVIDLAGVVGMEDQMILALKPKGRLLFIAGRFRVDYTFNTGQGREVTILQNSHFDREDLHLLCKYVELGRINLSPLLTRVAPVTEAKEIYETLRDNPDELMGTVFDW
ncbi:MAG: zinc-binding alcohol dehydrogenase [Candidatus Sumerlaeia bacterium]|nr:zinc-binding alcohol dehydrogenase [Candidatus Sumerlaeia bacterium]